MKRASRKLILFAAALFLFYILAGWKLPIIWRMETLKLPDGCKTVYQTKIRISDVYWLHTKGEKVIRCSMDHESAKAYIEEHNSEKALKYIDIYWYGGMSDLAIYDSQDDDAFWEQPDRENYIVVSYFRRWQEQQPE